MSDLKAEVEEYTEIENFFYPCMCHFCKEVILEIRRCSKCKRIGYCSRLHQMEDWPNHRKLCRAIATADKEVRLSHKHDMHAWREYKLQLKMKWESLLGRLLWPWEDQLWMFPRVCIICHSTFALHDCARCLNVSYCCYEHEMQDNSRHDEVCGLFKLRMDTDRYLRLKREYPQLKMIEKLFVEWPGSMAKVMEICFDLKNCESKDEYVEYVLATELVAPAATVVNALKIIDYSKEDIVIHCVGASLMETFLDWFMTAEFIFHWVHSLKTLTFILIGPDVEENFVLVARINEKFCQNCLNQQRTFDLKTYSKMYHHVVKNIPKADLIVCFNSGLHEYDSWKDSIPAFFEYANVPLLLTGYTLDEVLMDVERVERVFNKRLQVLLEPQINSFCGKKPLRNWEDEKEPLFYVNGYVTMLQTVDSPL